MTTTAETALQHAYALAATIPGAEVKRMRKNTAARVKWDGGEVMYDGGMATVKSYVDPSRVAAVLRAAKGEASE